MNGAGTISILWMLSPSGNVIISRDPVLVLLFLRVPLQGSAPHERLLLYLARPSISWKLELDPPVSQPSLLGSD